MIRNLEKKLKFIELIDKMKDIKRAIILINWRKETNAEHTFHVAMMVVLFIEDFPRLDQNKCLKMALFHDLVEIFAWDTVLFDEKMEKTKLEREKKALLMLEKVLWKSEFRSYKELIEEYENKMSDESIFVNQLDKLQPMIQVVLEWWKTWHEFKIDKKRLLKNKRAKIDWKFWLDKVLEKYLKIAEKNKMYYEEKY